MTTVSQMIEWMQTLPKDAEVMCGVEMCKGWSVWMEMQPVVIEACDVYDFSSENLIKRYPHRQGKIIVHICGE